MRESAHFCQFWGETGIDKFPANGAPAYRSRSRRPQHPAGQAARPATEPVHAACITCTAAGRKPVQARNARTSSATSPPSRNNDTQSPQAGGGRWQSRHRSTLVHKHARHSVQAARGNQSHRLQTVRPLALPTARASALPVVPHTHIHATPSRPPPAVARAQRARRAKAAPLKKMKDAKKKA